MTETATELQAEFVQLHKKLIDTTDEMNLIMERMLDSSDSDNFSLYKLEVDTLSQRYIDINTDMDKVWKQIRGE